AGKVAEYWASPTGAMLESAGVGVISDVQTGVDLLDTRAALLDPLNELRRTSLDEYAAIRSLYRQSRAAALAEARAGQISSRAPLAGVAAPVPATPESPATPTAAGTGAASGGGAGGAGAAPARVEASAPLPDDGGRGRIEFVDHQPAPAPESAAAPVSKSKTKKH
ncbi:MAG: hypothetical protein RLZZ501_1823, partial [Pseudomonadota bacterium]